MGGLLLQVKFTFSIGLLLVLLSQAAFTDLPDRNGPSDFFLSAADRGTALYQSDSENSSAKFMQVVHLEQGATIQLLHGDIVDPGNGEGVYGGNNPLISTQALADVWANFSPDHPHTFCLTNGQFYSSHASHVRLSFPLKVDGTLVSDGFAIDQFPEHQLMLEIWPNRANIVPLSAAALHNSSAPNILTGLDEKAAGRRPNTRTGRTFIGVGHPRMDGTYSTLFIFTSSFARKTEATAALSSFGAEKVMMIDGGASTQLICQGNSHIGPGRHIPQTIAVLAASLPDWGSVLYQPDLLLFCEYPPPFTGFHPPANSDWPQILRC